VTLHCEVTIQKKKEKKKDKEDKKNCKAFWFKNYPNQRDCRRVWI